MKKYPLYQIDAFTNEVFRGNPAAVVLLDDWLSDDTLQKIASENNLSETTFIVPNDNNYNIRWFTPTSEVDLCGHATLAASYVVFNANPKLSEITFHSKMSGDLSIRKLEENRFELNFPIWEGKEIAANPIQELLEISPVEVFDASDLVVVLKSEEEVRAFNPDPFKLSRLQGRGVILTAPGKDYDFISRAFYPKLGILEDPVTGSAHCALTPYWARKLGKNKLKAYQASQRDGEIECDLVGDRVLLSGGCALYLKGEIFHSD